MILAPALALSLALSGTPVTSGYGWEMGNTVTHLDTAGWSIQFYNTYARDRLTPTMRLTAAELEKNTGVDFRVETTIHTWDTPCPGRTVGGRHRIIVRLTPTVDRSSAYICPDANHAANSSYVRFALYRWDNQTRGGTHTAYRENVSSHELGHSVGLGHPDDEYVPYTDPLMSGNHWGGYSSISSAMKYTPYDVKGLKQLVLNR